MTFELSDRLQRLSELSSKKQQTIIEIDELGLLIGAQFVTRNWVIGDEGVNIGDPGLLIGGVIVDQNQSNYIHKDSSPVFTQQLLQDRGGSGSTTRAKFRLVDLNEELTNIFSPGQVVDEPLYVECKVYQSFAGGSHPEDSINVLNGLLTDIDLRAGHIDIQITSSDDLKKKEIYRKWTSTTSASVTDSDTTISFSSVVGFIEDQDVLTSYFVLDNEVIKVGSVSGNSFIGCTRGQLGSSAVAHNAGARARSMYRFQETGPQLALKLMLSGSGIYQTGVEVTNFVKIRAGVEFDNAVFFQGTDAKQKYGLSVGSFVTSSGATNPANNFTDREIISFGTDPNGTYFVVDGVALEIETLTGATLSFRSQYDTLPEGCAMKPTQVDIEEHQALEKLLSGSFPTYDFKETKTIKAKDFIDEQVYYPSGLSSIPRKGRASLKAQLPPLAFGGTKTFDETNIKDPDKLSLKRSVNKYFYNEIIYNYDYDPASEETTLVNRRESEQSAIRFPERGKVPLEIEARGLNSTHDNFILTQQRRYLVRFQFGAESTKIDVEYGAGFNAEIGDACIFGSSGLKISDTVNGTRNFQPRLMEIQNIKNSLMRGKFTMELLDTSSTLEGRFGVIGPSSLIDAGATTTNLPLKKSYGTGINQEENYKWANFIGEKIKVRNADFTFSEEVTIDGFSLNSVNEMIVSPALSLAPSEDYIVDMPSYSGDVNEKAIWKRVHCFIGPEVAVVSAANSTTITVSGSDISKFFVGSLLRVHTLDFTTDTDIKRIEVTNINVNTLTVTDLGFVPNSSFVINLVGFDSDEGKSYRYL